MVKYVIGETKSKVNEKGFTYSKKYKVDGASLEYKSSGSVRGRSSRVEFGKSFSGGDLSRTGGLDDYHMTRTKVLADKVVKE